MSPGAMIRVALLSGLLLPSAALRVEGADKNTELAQTAETNTEVAQTGGLTSFCKVGYSCVIGETLQATECLCKTLAHLHESAMPYDDKVAMLQALQDKNEDKLVRMRYRQTSRNLLMNMFGSHRNHTGSIAEMASGDCESGGYKPVDLKANVPLGVGDFKLAIQNVDEKLFNYRKFKIQNIAPAVSQAIQYGEKMKKDIFLKAVSEKCVSGDTAAPELLFGE